MASVRIVAGDLLDQNTDALVNAWNRNLLPWWLLVPSGVSRAIRRRAGAAPFRELRRHGLLALGAAVATGAGRLPHRAIIHVAGIDLLWRASDFSIRASARNACRLALAHGFASLAFPVLGSGAGGYPHAAALAALRNECERMAPPLDIVIVTRSA